VHHTEYVVVLTLAYQKDLSMFKVVAVDCLVLCHVEYPGAGEPFFQRGVKVKNQQLLSWYVDFHKHHMQFLTSTPNFRGVSWPSPGKYLPIISSSWCFGAVYQIKSSQMRIANVAKVHGSVVDIWMFTAKSWEMIAGKSVSIVCDRNLSRRRMTDYKEAGCSRGWMQQLETNVGQQ